MRNNCSEAGFLVELGFACSTRDF